MVDVRRFVDCISSAGCDFFTGVPDSLLKSFCAHLTDEHGDRHVIAANEGGAVGLAAGHYLATGRPALVYMQNSGQGNAVNPLVSLADRDVYAIPMVLLVGWRGEPGRKDEPQHVKQGKVTVSLFETLDIPTAILPDGEDAALGAARDMVWRARNESRPVALVVRKGLFAECALRTREADLSAVRREDAIEAILSALGDGDVVVSTTGMISREVYETRERMGQGHSRDFLTVGSMGHSSMIALGIARACADVSCRRVVCIDGDGSSIMHMGSMAIAGAARRPNLVHIVLNNAAHDSVGGQPTVGGRIDLSKIAEACGYRVAGKLESGTSGELRAALRRLIGPEAGTPPGGGDPRTTFMEIQVAKGARKDLGRPREPPQTNKVLYMETLAS